MSDAEGKDIRPDAPVPNTQAAGEGAMTPTPSEAGEHGAAQTPTRSEPEAAAGEPVSPQAPVPPAAPVAPASPAAPTPVAAAPLPPPRPSAPSARRSRLATALAERPEVAIELPRARLSAQSRRDFLLYTAGVIASAAVAWWLLPDRTKARLLPGDAHDRLDTLAARVGLSSERGERLLDRALTFDDDVSEALYSKDRRVRTYARSEARPLRNNYDGQTPGPEYLATWSLAVSGLASGRTEHLTAPQLMQRFALREQVTRLVCVEGWSGIAWWGGIPFAAFLKAFPPAPGARWAAIRSAVNLDADGNPDPYYVSIDLDTARHPQTLLATHHEGRPLTLAHGAPVRLLAPMKLGLKNIKAITDVTYTASEPPDYWNERGYSKYDGL